ncbi:hypothetical protein ACHAWF_000092, partial [Thalassiosira exigua]
MSRMFQDAKSFNRDIGFWSVSNVTNMESMFQGAIAFNQPVGLWNVTNVTNMAFMFYGASVFDQDLTKWDVSHIESEPNGFAINSGLSSHNNPWYDASSNFYLHENKVTVMCPNAEIGETGIINGVTYTKRSKGQITTANAKTSCTSGITNLSNMFSGHWLFGGGGISTWDVSSVTDMSGMFDDAIDFN